MVGGLSSLLVRRKCSKQVQDQLLVDLDKLDFFRFFQRFPKPLQVLLLLDCQVVPYGGAEIAVVIVVLIFKTFHDDIAIWCLLDYSRCRVFGVGVVDGGVYVTLFRLLFLLFIAGSIGICTITFGYSYSSVMSIRGNGHFQMTFASNNGTFQIFSCLRVHVVVEMHALAVFERYSRLVWLFHVTW